MFAIIGLGNPGSKYTRTRHNIGFRVLDRAREKYCHAASWQEKFNCKYVKTQLNGEDTLFIQPQLYMNLSGEAAAPLLNFFRVGLDEIAVVHDELDLDPGIIRVKCGGSSGGQRGVENLIQFLGNPNFQRVRIGIGHPRRNAQGRQKETDPADWVLGIPSPADEQLLGEAVENSLSALELLVKGQFDAAQQQFNRKQSPGEAEK